MFVACPPHTEKRKSTAPLSSLSLSPTANPQKPSGLAIFAVLWQVRPHMSAVVEITEAIAHLSPQEYCGLIADLQPFPDDESVLQMRAGTAPGKPGFVDRNIEAARLKKN